VRHGIGYQSFLERDPKYWTPALQRSCGNKTPNRDDDVLDRHRAPEAKPSMAGRSTIGRLDNQLVNLVVMTFRFESMPAALGDHHPLMSALYE
jgi:hypothetical protein